MKKRKDGFTLIELIAVLVILAVISLIVVPLVLNIVKKTKISANKRSVDAYGKSVELAIANYIQKNRDYPSSFKDIEVEYTGKKVECKIFIFNDDVDSSVYLSGCSVDGVEVLDENNVDGYYHYGKSGLNNKYYVSTYGLFVDKAINEYINKNSSIPSSLDELDINYNEKNVSCNKFKMVSENNFFISECFVDGIEVLDEDSNDGYYHYGESNEKYNYKIGDVVTYKDMKFYVIENSNKDKDYVVLLKADPLTHSEVNEYGVGHINMYATNRMYHSYYQQAQYLGGPGAIAYYTSETCGYPIVYPNSGYDKYVATGCLNSYDTSDIKYVIDNWSKEFNSDLVIDDTGYSSRIMNIDDLINNLNYKKYWDNIVSTSESPKWVHINNCYWTMTQESRNQMYSICSNSISRSTINSGDSTVIRPVINLKKSAITE